MRVQLMLAAASLFTVAARGQDDGVAARVDVYVDPGITVVNQGGSASVEAPDGVRASGHYDVDVVSGATRAWTPDAISSATRFAEQRVEGGIVVGFVPAEGMRLDGSFATSSEPDYSTHAVGLAAQSEVIDRRGLASIGGSLSVDRIGITGDPRFSEVAVGGALDAGYTHALSPGTSLSVFLTTQLAVCGQVIGCHASPYRYVPVVLHAGDDHDVRVGLRERHPDLRARGAAAVRLSQSLGDGLALHGGWRAYADTWQVTGHTADIAVAQGALADRLLLRADARATWQSAASFHRSSYAVDDGGAAPAWRTSDRELGELYDLAIGARASWTFAPLWIVTRPTLSARAMRLWYRYPTDPFVPARDAWLIGVGAAAGF